MVILTVEGIACSREFVNDRIELVLFRVPDHAKGIDVLSDQADDITATAAIPMEVSLTGLVTWMADDDGVGLTTGTITQTHFYVASYTSPPVQLVAEVGGDIVDTYLSFECRVLVIHPSFHFLPLPSSINHLPSHIPIALLRCSCFGCESSLP